MPLVIGRLGPLGERDPCLQLRNASRITGMIGEDLGQTAQLCGKLAHAFPEIERLFGVITGERSQQPLLRRKPDYVIRWIPADSLETSILDGAYTPLFRAPLKPLFGTPGSTVLQVWKRAG